jgi:hypothetical protein
MKKLLFSFALLASAAAMYAQPYAVTFRVDMRGHLPAPGGKVTVSGDFAATATPPAPNWTQGLLELTDANSDMVYEGTFQLAGGPIKYKFATTDAMGANANWEGQPDRVATVAAATVLPIHCFGVDGVGNCPVVVGTPDTVNVTIKIDFTRAFGIFGSPFHNIICIAGDLQQAAGFPSNWSPNVTLLQPETPGSKVYTTTLRLLEGTYAYKAIFGDDWGYDEAPVGACVAGGNRKLVVPGTHTGQGNGTYTEGPFCFGSCAACDPLGAQRPVVFTVDVTDEAPGATYFINGTFNFPAFQAASNVAMASNANNTFSHTLNMYPGDYQYHFSQNDGTTTTNENFNPAGCPEAIAGPVGDLRRTVTVPAGTGPYYVNVYKYNTCTMVATEETKRNAAFFQVAPNPFTGTARINFSNESNSTFGVVMTDIAGKTVRTMNNLTGSNVTIEQGTLITGVYFVTLTTANGARFTQKLVIQ